jgi:hypothetical protein
MRTLIEEIQGANILSVSVTQNGFKGGDSGHGGFVVVRFDNISGTDMTLNGEPCEFFEFEFKGDSERETLMKALRIILNELETHSILTR